MAKNGDYAVNNSKDKAEVAAERRYEAEKRAQSDKKSIGDKNTSK